MSTTSAIMNPSIANFKIVQKQSPLSFSGIDTRSSPPNQGPVGVVMDAFSLIGGSIKISPSSSNQVYTLPTLTSLVQQYGSDITTGVSNVKSGDLISLKVFNTGTFPAIVSTNSTTGAYGDGSKVVCSNTSTSYTGTSPVGHATNLHIQVSAISSGLYGSTGSYTVFSS